ncbi:MAG: glyceraldehyde-3-phosphate dehydrogenase [Thiovulaceae bacterium]|nr:glyceraldehyde-3-phosphate dehydrogenase [Sulfurimonadaceae bacterium]
MQKIRVFINGFGRIGRSALRVLLEDDAFEIVGINDIFPVSQYPYLMQYDSLYKELPQKITLEDELLHVGGDSIRLYCQAEPLLLDLSSLHVDVLLQCSGLFLSREANESYLCQGVKKVILSAPPKDDIPTYIMGFNHQQYQDEKIISNSSCSTNAIAPLMQLIDKRYGISDACISMVHSYTGDQNLLDVKNPFSELRRSRSATQNILPLESTATATLGSLFPHLRDKLYTKSIRVPVSATTLYDFTLHVENPTERDALNDLFIETSHGVLHNIIGTDDTWKVSSDFVKNRHSATIDLPLTEVLDSHCIKMTAWQDNEYGYAYQLVEMAKIVFEKEIQG